MGGDAFVGAGGNQYGGVNGIGDGGSGGGIERGWRSDWGGEN